MIWLGGPVVPELEPAHSMRADLDRSVGSSLCSPLLFLSLLPRDRVHRVQMSRVRHAPSDVQRVASCDVCLVCEDVLAHVVAFDEPGYIFLRFTC